MLLRPPLSPRDGCLNRVVDPVINIPASGTYLPTERDFPGAGGFKPKTGTKIISTPTVDPK